MSATIRKIGNSSEERNRLVITKAKRCPRYSLEELLAQCDTGAQMPEELNKWDTLPPAGDEMLLMR
ncbi:AbrB/MazE/SpoVT family DNA-binding domain-containing protein [Endozoicomonas euniceicola]|uniref:Uncharacterized protein n=1 Tax=Endozoicomonas euniceicola TaxID=1234143 RepID=A0ABY6GRA2_9GAMM|nr:hypothetical protein [Endozoicomonas euniceicola]UYM15282.1 hypothetical protein NX720_20865 [Endozoicomonas euniceicola]